MAGAALVGGVLGGVVRAQDWKTFNGKLRDEHLGLQWFRNRLDAKVGIEQWRRHYNDVRPHSSLRYLTPTEFKAIQIAGPIAGGARRRRRLALPRKNRRTI